MSSIPPPSLLHLSPVGNRESIRRNGIDPACASGRDKVIWAVEAPAMFLIQRHLRELRGPQSLDIWLITTKTSGPWRRWRETFIWRTSFVICRFDVLHLGTLQSVKPALLNGLAGVH